MAYESESRVIVWALTVLVLPELILFRHQVLMQLLSRSDRYEKVVEVLPSQCEISVVPSHHDDCQ